jgi:hypothetical protein
MLRARSRICKGCWQQLHLPVPLRGIASLPFRIFGIRPSRMNWNSSDACPDSGIRTIRATTYAAIFARFTSCTRDRPLLWAARVFC